MLNGKQFEYKSEQKFGFGNINQTHLEIKTPLSNLFESENKCI